MVSATINGKVINVFVSWYFPRSASFVHLKKKGKAVPSTSPVSSQYLRSLKVLEDKCMPKKSPELNKVDNLRAAVFQVDFKNEQTNKQKCAYKGPDRGVKTSYFLEISIFYYIPFIGLQV